MSRLLDTPRRTATPPHAEEQQRLPHLRLVDRREPQVDAPSAPKPPVEAPPVRDPRRWPSSPPSRIGAASGTAAHSSSACVLVVGADAQARERMLEELRSLLPDGTPFAEAEATWEAIARAADSSMVVLAGDLADVSAGSLMRSLARRNPMLPVLAIGEDRRSPRARPCPAGGGELGACQAVDTPSA